MLRLRGFLPGDTQPVSHLVAATFTEPYPPALWADISSYWPDGFIVAEQDGALAGLLAAVRDSEASARVLLLAVARPLRNRGIGKAALREFVRRCGAMGLRFVSLEVRVSNAPAIRFYEAHGFQVTERIPAFYTDGEDGFRMVLFL